MITSVLPISSMNNEKNQIGVVGLAAMGANIAMNFADRGFRTAVFNRSPARTEALIGGYGSGKGLDPTYTTEAFVASLARPRKIILMVEAGEAVDRVIDSLRPLLESGDIVVDGGNSFFRDTIRREASLRESGIEFVGLGVSGGEEGARRGPSLMFGGSMAAWEALSTYLRAIAAKDFSGEPCIARLGEGGAGHYVKMVHNGIEYSDMQLIAEAYSLMKDALRYPNDAIADRFRSWNEGRLESFLIEISGRIFRTKEHDGGYVVDRILDSAGSKGTGKWTAEQSLELGEPSFSLTAAVFARYASAAKERRLRIAEAYPKHAPERITFDEEDIERALHAAKLLSYAQGYALLAEASKTYGWDLDFAEISRIWQGGCIIRARFLTDMEQVFRKYPGESDILLSHGVRETLGTDLPALRAIVAEAALAGIAIPGLSSALSYFDSMSSASLPANLIQAQRDLFGAHTFRRTEGGPAEHFDWR